MIYTGEELFSKSSSPANVSAKKGETITVSPFLYGAGNQNRTDDLVITNDVLYRLSHTSDSVIITDSSYFVKSFFIFIFNIFSK